MTRLGEIRARADAGEVLDAEDLRYLFELVDRLCAQIAGADRREREGTRKDAR